MRIEKLDDSGCPDHGEMTLLADWCGVRVVGCETCKRLVALGGDKGLAILLKGDFWAKHRFHLGPLDIAGLTISTLGDVGEDTDYSALFQPPQGG